MPRKIEPPTLQRYAKNRIALTRLASQIELDVSKNADWRQLAIKQCRDLLDTLYDASNAAGTRAAK